MPHPKEFRASVQRKPTLHMATGRSLRRSLTKTTRANCHPHNLQPNSTRSRATKLLDILHLAKLGKL